MILDRTRKNKKALKGCLDRSNTCHYCGRRLFTRRRIEMESCAACEERGVKGMYWHRAPSWIPSRMTREREKNGVEEEAKEAGLLRYKGTVKNNYTKCKTLNEVAEMPCVDYVHKIGYYYRVALNRGWKYNETLYVTARNIKALKKEMKKVVPYR